MDVWPFALQNCLNESLLDLKTGAGIEKFPAGRFCPCDDAAKIAIRMNVFAPIWPTVRNSLIVAVQISPWMSAQVARKAHNEPITLP
jgi:hypothetical protein